MSEASRSEQGGRGRGDAVANLLDMAHPRGPYDLADAIAGAAKLEGWTEVETLVVDFQQEQLTVLGASTSSTQEPGALARGMTRVEATIAGRAFVTGAPVLTPGPGGRTTVHAPVLDGIERLGVLRVGVAHADSWILARIRRFVDLIAQLITTKSRATDEIHRSRAMQPMTLAAQMQWQILPPLTAHCPEVVVAGQVEPAYEIGGDAFDYALNHGRAQFAILDAMGHGVRAGMATTLAVGAYRTSRRRGEDLGTTVTSIDQALCQEFDDDRYVTALLAELDFATGHLAWVSAGHPAPLLLRGHHIVGLPAGAPALPLGLGLPEHPAPGVVDAALEPGDVVLLVTDGILEAHNDEGEQFGVDGLAELTRRAAHARLPLAELVRTVARGVLDYQHGKLRDDASILALEWVGPAKVGAHEQELLLAADATP